MVTKAKRTKGHHKRILASVTQNTERRFCGGLIERTLLFRECILPVFKMIADSNKIGLFKMITQLVG